MLRSASGSAESHLHEILAIFGPTAVGKTGVAIAVAERLRERGEDPVAVSCDALQVYRGIETLTAAPSASEREWLEHRLVGIADVGEEFSAGRFAKLARREIDELLAEGRRPIVVGGTGLYLRAALAELELRPPVPAEIREQVESEIAERGTESLHGELDPALRSGVHPNDRKRIARALELQRAGLEPPPPGGGELWTAELRHPTALIGLTMDREAHVARIAERTREIAAAGAAEEARRADRAGASRTARAAIGFDELLAGDIDAYERAQRAFAKRQLTWLRRLEGVEVIDRTGLDDAAVADRVTGLLDAGEAFV
ncbi:MAG TPA: tRNA (adenosine(37)-N6)-dimethylallyltransferase MiaA [Solirubrobacterales bacterium]